MIFLDLKITFAVNIHLSQDNFNIPPEIHGTHLNNALRDQHPHWSPCQNYQQLCWEKDWDAWIMLFKYIWSRFSFQLLSVEVNSHWSQLMSSMWRLRTAQRMICVQPCKWLFLRPQEWMPREIVDDLSLELFKTRLDGALSKLV